MRTRRSIFVCLTLAAAYVAFAGCGGDDDATPPATDAGKEAALTDTTTSFDARADARSPEYTGSACIAATDCYSDLDGAALQGGEAVCIDKVTGGYCTHKCQTDADCCAIPGECRTGLRQVCASFENAADKYCFLSCEEEDIASANDAGATDAGGADGGFDGEEYCHKNASPEFGCRSTGGGVENRQVCFPIGPVGDGGAGDGGKKDSGLLDASLDADAN